MEQKSLVLIESQTENTHYSRILIFGRSPSIKKKNTCSFNGGDVVCVGGVNMVCSPEIVHRRRLHGVQIALVGVVHFLVNSATLTVVFHLAH